MSTSSTSRYRFLRWVGFVAIIALCLSLAPSAYASHSPAPTMVVLPGTFQSELGCGGDWDPACANSALTAVAGSSGMIWRGVYNVPAGSHEYKAALNGTWDESYASPPIVNGNKGLTLGGSQPVTFYYDHESHWLADTVNNRIAVVAGSLQSELGCPGDWQPDCLLTWMTDGDNNNVATFTTDQIPAGSYEYKVALNEGWGESYPANNVPISVPAGATVIFSFNLITNEVSHQVLAGAGHDNDIWWGNVHHDSRDTTYRNPGGPVTLNTPVTLRIKTAANDLTSATLRLYNDRSNTESLIPMTSVYNDGTDEYWEATAPASAVSTVYWYRFILTDGTDTDYYEDDTRRTGGAGQMLDGSADRSWQLTVYDPALDTPDWVKSGIIYQIFPDRFRNGDTGNDTAPNSFFYADPNETIVRSDTGFGTGNVWNNPVCDPRNGASSTPNCLNYYSNNFYGGDLQGITQKIAYLQSLGVTVIYLNPIFESPSNHKYDTTDYGIVDDNYGGNAAFAAFIAQADAAGMHVILDGVFNHTSSDSIYFDRYGNFPVVGACESAASAFRSWYFFSGTGPCAGQNYESWFGYDSLPKLNGANNDVRNLIWQGGAPSPSSNIAAYWLQQGADGWRLDVGGDLDQGVINSPTNNYWEGFRASVHNATPGEEYIVGEEWGNATSWVLGSEWDATMNYQFSSAIMSFWRDETLSDNDHNSGSSAGTLSPLTADELNERLLHLQEIYPPEALQAMMNLLGSHDTNRALFLLDENADEAGTTRATYENPAYDWSDAMTRLKGVALLQFTMPGAPTIYYGDEIGLVAPPTKDGSGWQDDPYNRIPYPWLDGSGNPEPGTGTPYYIHLQSAAGQNQLRDHYALLATTRNAHPALSTGDFRTLMTHNTDQVIVYGRRLADLSDAAVVFVNRSGVQRNVTVTLGGYLPDGMVFTDVFTSLSYTVTGGSLTVNNIPARSGALLVRTGGPVVMPLTPPVLSATSGNGQVTLNWGAVTGAADYEVFRAPMSGGPYTSIGTTAATTYNDTGLVNGTRYYYVVIARSGGLNSAYSNEVLAVPAAPIDWCNLQWPPTIILTISATTPTENIYGQVYIAGVTEPPGQGAGVLGQVGYGAVGSDANNWTWFNTTFNTQFFDNDEYQGTLLPSAVGTFNYLYRFSTNGGVTWTYCDISGPTTAAGYANPGELTVNASGDTTAPSVPTLSVTSVSPTSVSLGWTASTDDASVYGYDVLRSTTAGGPFAQIARVTSGMTYTDNTVSTGITYYYVVQAIDTSFNFSANSNEVSATPEPRSVTVTFRVGVPAYTPGTVYIVGDHPNLCTWCNPHTQAMTQINATTWEYTTTMIEGTLVNFKFTRGNWEKVEDWGSITGLGNRSATILYGVDGNQLIDMTATDWGNGADSTKAVQVWHDPLVVSHAPAAGATGVVETSPITVAWSIPMQGTPDFSVTAGGSPVAGTFSYDSGTWISSFVPTGGAFAPNTTYTVNVTGEVAQNGQTQLVAKSFSFTTGNTLNLVTINQPHGNTSCAPRSAWVIVVLRNLVNSTNYTLTLEALQPSTSTVFMIRQFNISYMGATGSHINFKAVVFKINDNPALIPSGWSYNSTWTTLPAPIELWVALANRSTGAFSQMKLTYDCTTGATSILSNTHSPTTPANYAP